MQEVIKNSANAKAAAGLTSGAFGKKAARKHKGGGGGGGVASAWKQFLAADSSLPPRFEKARGGPGRQLPFVVCFKCQEKGHMSKVYPNKYILVSEDP